VARDCRSRVAFKASPSTTIRRAPEDGPPRDLGQVVGEAGERIQAASGPFQPPTWPAQES
jgi:hypothetical protein